MVEIICVLVLGYLLIGALITGVMINNGYGGLNKFTETLEINAEIRSFIGGRKIVRRCLVGFLILAMVAIWPWLFYNLIK